MNTSIRVHCVHTKIISWCVYWPCYKWNVCLNVQYNITTSLKNLHSHTVNITKMYCIAVISLPLIIGTCVSGTFTQVLRHLSFEYFLMPLTIFYTLQYKYCAVCFTALIYLSFGNCRFRLFIQNITQLINNDVLLQVKTAVCKDIKIIAYVKH